MSNPTQRKDIPNHYAPTVEGEGFINISDVDTIEYTRIQLGLDAAIAVCQFNIIKYATRALRKGTPIEDTIKIGVYQQRMLEYVREKEKLENKK